MSKQIIVSEDEYETRVALLENNELAEIFAERKESDRTLGNVYKGRVNSILPGMQVAFVDIGMERNAFLHVSDIRRDINEFGELEVEGENNKKSSRSNNKGKRPSITDLIKKSQEILVQIDKESMGVKGPRVTAHITLPGRYLVYMPTAENIGVSRRITDEQERQRLKEVVQRLRPERRGFIVRTAAEGKGEAEFSGEIEYLQKHWQQICHQSGSASAPALVHEDMGLLFRIIRDIFTEDVSEFVIDAKNQYRRIQEYISDVLPSLKSRVKFYEKRDPIFEYYGLEKALQRALRNKIWLKCGGYIVIEQTEAMVSIDVNTGKYVGKENPDETILKTNLEAVEEITRQIRLRDVGGIIVIDFIDMDNAEHRKQVFNALQEALKKDRSRTNVLSFTELGLIEMTRQRTKPSLKTTLCQTCPYCNGYGTILSEDTITIRLLRDIKKAYYKGGKKGLKIVANEFIAERLLQEDANKVQKLADTLNVQLEVEGDPDLHMKQYHILSLNNNKEISLN